jgi:hypothetical protein
MANFLLKIGASSGYEDGDIIVAPNRKRIRSVYASHICHVDKVPFNTDGLRSSDELNLIYMSKTHQYRFNRVSEKEILRTDLLTGMVELFSDTTEQHIYVQEFINQQKTFGHHRIYGTSGNEFWFGKEIYPDHPVWNVVWGEIEQRTTERENKYKHFPFTEIEHRHFLPLTSQDDFNDETSSNYESSEYDDTVVDEVGTPTLVSKRKHTLEWRDANLGLSVEDIQNKRKHVDVLHIPLRRDLLVKKKARR